MALAHTALAIPPMRGPHLFLQPGGKTFQIAIAFQPDTAVPELGRVDVTAGGRPTEVNIGPDLFQEVQQWVPQTSG